MPLKIESKILDLEMFEPILMEYICKYLKTFSRYEKKHVDAVKTGKLNKISATCIPETKNSSTYLETPCILNIRHMNENNKKKTKNSL